MTAVTAIVQQFRLDRTKSGLALLRDWIDQGYVAGLNGTLKARPILAERGHVKFVCDVDENHANFIGLVHGGVGAALVDIAGGAVAMTLLEPGETLLTTDLSVRYLQPAVLGMGAMHAEGHVLYNDPRKTVVDVIIRCGEEVVAVGSAGIATRPAR